MDTDIDKHAFKALAEKYANDWGCSESGDVFYTHSSLLWPMVKDNQNVMMKIVKDDDDEARSADILRFFDGCSAVKVLESDQNVMLLERIAPAANMPTLEQMVLQGDDAKATHILCDVIDDLHAVPLCGDVPEHLIPFRTRSDSMREHMAEGRVKKEQLPFFEYAADLCDELIAETLNTQIPLHGDIHHFNVMHCAKRGWLAIDPKGIQGPRIYEYANMLCNPYKHEDIVPAPERMIAQASIISERADLDKNLLLHFVFLHGMQCAAWSLYEPDQNYWLSCAKTAADLVGINFNKAVQVKIRAHHKL